ncbi:hypothetical protein J5J10_04830 [Ciceribacter sp. L1K23]|uniref:hypothetical protein n=1 Tax=Ciceribacter sp. L1K23 TaxID=2820276 RepID=UPI001B824735|nr:hypothetical protein [Ciceribacter sp. L1K23]MBR0554999.1 hypothetical protein [Ciceribacter sp. L1K23]
MNKIYLDTALLAVPNYAIDAETGQELIDRIVHFSELADPDIPLQLIISSTAEETLWGSNFGPDYEQIDQFLDIMELKNFYSTNDILQRYQLLFQHCARAADVNLVEVDSLSHFSVQPQLPAASPAQLINETQRVFATAAALAVIQQPVRVGSAFYSSPSSEYEVQATLATICGHGSGHFDPLPAHIHATVSTFTHLRDLVSSDVADELWRIAQTAEDIHFSITLGALALQVETGEGVNVSALEKFSIGSEFVNSLQQVECWGTGRFSGTTRELCSQIVAKKCNRKINPFSLTGQHIRSFDSARAWRTHLTNSGLGLRLMFWQGKNGIEFANVDVKGGERIDTGSEVPAAAPDIRGCFN